jgi:hypothetical protein
LKQFLLYFLNIDSHLGELVKTTIYLNVICFSIFGASASCRKSAQPSITKDLEILRPTTMPAARSTTNGKLKDADKTFSEVNSAAHIRLVPGLNARKGGQLTVQSFKQLMTTAVFLTEKDNSPDDWAYAPWYTGWFTSEAGTYRFELYLGGRGRVTTPQGKQMLFQFDDIHHERKT